MTDLRTAAQQALEALEMAKLNGKAGLYPAEVEEIADAITNLRAALAEPQEPVEPVAYIHRQGRHWEVSERPLADDEKARGWTEEPLFTAPQQRKPLTSDKDRPDQGATYVEGYGYVDTRAVRAVERKVRGEDKWPT